MCAGSYPNGMFEGALTSSRADLSQDDAPLVPKSLSIREAFTGRDLVQDGCNAIRRGGQPMATHLLGEQVSFV